jgi:hypothetical protein
MLFVFFIIQITISESVDITEDVNNQSLKDVDTFPAHLIFTFNYHLSAPSTKV